MGKIGGVQIDVANPTSGRATFRGPKLRLHPGPQMLNGDQALVYLQGADLTSDAQLAKRQHALLSAMLSQALGLRNLVSEPIALNVVLDNARTDMSALEAIQLAVRLQALEGSDDPVGVLAVPGRDAASAVSNTRGDRPGEFWVPDDTKVPQVVG